MTAPPTKRRLSSALVPSTKGHFRVSKTFSFKTSLSLSQNLFCANEFYLNKKKNIFISTASHFNFALSLALKQRLGATRK